MLLLNQDVMTTNPEGVVTYRSGRNAEGRRLLTLKEDDVALVFRADHALPYGGLLKNIFAAAHNPSTTLEEANQVARLYNLPVDDFRRTMRTVGCGTNAYLILDDGVFQVMVQRTAPDKTPAGIDMPGAYSRAAGGANGAIDPSTFREWVEECNIFIHDDHGNLTSVDIAPVDHHIDDGEIMALTNEKYGRLGWIARNLLPHDLKTKSIQTMSVAAWRLGIDGLTETVMQDIGGRQTALTNKLVVEEAAKGDICGIDDILAVRLPGVRSSQIIICDGETDPDGALLGRQWFLKSGYEWADQVNQNKIKVSPTPARLLQFNQQVHEAIGRLKF